MKDPQVVSAAICLRSAFDCQSGGGQIQMQTQYLAQTLGGYADTGRMEHGQAALYILTLLLSRLEDE